MPMTDYEKMARRLLEKGGVMRARRPPIPPRRHGMKLLGFVMKAGGATLMISVLEDLGYPLWKAAVLVTTAWLLIKAGEIVGERGGTK